MKKNIILVLTLLPLLVLAKANNEKKCIFGDRYDNALENNKFKSIDKGARFVKDKINNIMPWVHVQEYELFYYKEKRLFRMFYTFEDFFDGGNTWGWIEDADSKEIVAQIGDSEIFGCTVLVLPQENNKENCIFGDSYENTLENHKFKSIDKGDRFVKDKINNTVPWILVKEYELFYYKEKILFRMFYTSEDFFDGGNSWGWIEDAATKKIVAEIGDSEIFNCKVFY